MRTQAEAHRDILKNMFLCPMVASAFRGAKNIPFEDLEAAAREGLCEAARDWRGVGKFAAFAQVAMTNQVKNFIRDWGGRAVPIEDPDIEFPHQVFQSGKADYSKDSGRIYEWSSWSQRDLINAISENWKNEDLANSPEGLAIAFGEIKDASSAIDAVLIGSTERDRKIFIARFFSKPKQTLESIARSVETKHGRETVTGISYARTVFIIDRMIKQIREILESREGRHSTDKAGLVVRQG